MMGIFRFRKRDNPEKVIILDGAGKQDPETEKQLDQLISDLKEENQKPKEPVEFRQALPKAREWTETVETKDEEDNNAMARLHHNGKWKCRCKYDGSIRNHCRARCPHFKPTFWYKLWCWKNVRDASRR